MCNPQIRSVYNKTDQLHNVFRTPELQLLSGKDETEIIHKEDGIRMKVDVRKVYFCARLHFERKRICDKYVKDGQIIADVFCGIGPFALMAAIKKKCICHANDLNPECK